MGKAIELTIGGKKQLIVVSCKKKPNASLNKLPALKIKEEPDPDDRDYAKSENLIPLGSIKTEPLEMKVEPIDFENDLDLKQGCLAIKAEPLDECQEIDCPKCSERQIAYCLLLFHECIVENINCTVCAPITQLLLGELKSHTTLKTIFCLFCNIAFLEMRDLQDHICHALQSTTFKCSLCELVCNSKSLYYTHLLNSHCGLQTLEATKTKVDAESGAQLLKKKPVQEKFVFLKRKIHNLPSILKRRPVPQLKIVPAPSVVTVNPAPPPSTSLTPPKVIVSAPPSPETISAASPPVAISDTSPPEAISAASPHETNSPTNESVAAATLQQQSNVGGVIYWKKKALIPDPIVIPKKLLRKPKIPLPASSVSFALEEQVIFRHDIRTGKDGKEFTMTRKIIRINRVEHRPMKVVKNAPRKKSSSSLLLPLYERVTSTGTAAIGDKPIVDEKIYSEYNTVNLPAAENPAKEVTICERETCTICLDRQGALCMNEFHACPVSDRGTECEVCQHISRHLILVARDTSVHVGYSVIRCVFCISEFPDMETLRLHKCLIIEKKWYRCRHCGVKFETLPKLCNHLFFHFRIKAYECRVCSQQFVVKYRFQSHVRDHTMTPKYQCPTCSENFLRRREYRNHMFKVHMIEKPHKCELCGRSFGAKFQLTLHMNTHLEKKPFPCKKCERSFVKARNLEHHEYNFHGGGGFIYCKICSRKLASPARLRSHMRTHDVGKAFECEKCKKSFASQGTLTRHSRIHTDEVIKCDFEGCNYTTFYLWQLKAHKVNHTGIKPMACKICSRAFSTKRSLVKHVGRHHYLTYEQYVRKLFLKSKVGQKKKHRPSHALEEEGSVPESDPSNLEPIVKLELSDGNVSGSD